MARSVMLLLQKWDLGEWIKRMNRPVISLVLFAVASSAFIGGLKITGPELSWDSKDYAQLARQVARGEGQTTELLVWELIPEIERRNSLAGPWPNLLRPPLPVYAISVFFSLLGYSDISVTLWSGVFYVGSVILMFWCFEGIFGRRIALISGLLFALSRCGLVYARSGLTESSATFFLLLAFLIAVKFPSLVGASLTGLVLGLCSLGRPIAGLWAVVFAGHFVIGAQDQTLRRFWKLSLVLASFVIPGSIAMYWLDWEGSKGAAAINLAYRVGDPWLAMGNPLRFVMEHPGAMISKFFHEISRPLVYLFRLGDFSLFSGLAPFGLLFCKDARQRFARNLLVAIFASNVIVLGVLMAGDAFVGPLRYFDIFAPLALPWAVQALFQLYYYLPDKHKVYFMGLMILYATGSTFQAIRSPFPPRSRMEVYQEIRRLVPVSEVIAASAIAQPPSIAWYSDRRTVYIPAEREDLVLHLKNKGMPVNWCLRLDNEPHPQGFLIAERWPGGFVLWRSYTSLKK